MIFDLKSSFIFYYDNSVYLEISFKKIVISLLSLMIYPLKEIGLQFYILRVQDMSRALLLED